MTRRASSISPEYTEQESSVEAKYVTWAVTLSTWVHSVVDSAPVRISRMIVIMLAFSTLAVRTSHTLDDAREGALDYLDWLIDSYFIALGVLKLIAVHAKITVKRTLEGKIRKWDIFKNSGVIDATVSALSLSFGQGVVGDWFRLIRVLIISTFFLQHLPHIDVLVSGISLGVRSLISTWLLLTLVFIVYAACALTFFGKNDPMHFGSMAMSMWTFFQLATLDNWSLVMYINMYGCDAYPSDYSESGDVLYVERYGKMLMPVCRDPSARPILTAVIFVSFILLCGFILVSLTIAAVTSGINDRLNELEKEEAIAVPLVDSNEESLLNDREMLLMLMLQVWGQDEEIADEDDSDINTSDKAVISLRSRFTCVAFRGFDIRDIKSVSVAMRNLTNHALYKNCLACCLAGAAFLEIWLIQNPDSGVGHFSVLRWVLQSGFSIDIVCKVLAHYPTYSSFFRDRWNTFDLVLVLVTWVPMFTIGQSSHEYFGLLRVLRILRLLRLLSWIADLNVILRAISSSAKALLYVIMLMFLFFFHFAIAGVYLFRENDVYKFGNLFTAFLTLFQVSTLDDWSEVARTNMYGCDLYGYSTGEDYFDSECDRPRGLGWFAAWYFVLFIIFGVMVLVSLFVGIIIASMELLKEGIKEENEVWIKVKEMQKVHKLSDTTVDNLLEIFDLIDVAANGKLTLSELKPVLELVSVTQTDQFSLFMMVDDDSSGQIDFAEFIQLIHYMGLAYKRNIKKLKLKKTPSSMNMLSHGIMGSTGNFFASVLQSVGDGFSPVKSRADDKMAMTILQGDGNRSDSDKDFKCSASNDSPGGKSRDNFVSNQKPFLYSSGDERGAGKKGSKKGSDEESVYSDSPVAVVASSDEKYVTNISDEGLSAGGSDNMDNLKGHGLSPTISTEQPQLSTFDYDKTQSIDPPTQSTNGQKGNAGIDVFETGGSVPAVSIPDDSSVLTHRIASANMSIGSSCTSFQ
eukprot:CAMPEP_0185029542 /NCGR_PEP_ID=MMETSP1103-20130426/15903_1 /TAXON_ID=36769 /ORGANISM="Paraphysomonas bandaiensis, Strain Caron Lab Isolate" /LENGTH=970 /DNA_ID=CAMNT_0027564335 /DNA_START=184 /DNA_END=3096 /DNA_ORIENTATION=+